MESRLIVRDADTDMPAGILAHNIPDNQEPAGYQVDRIPDFTNAAYPEPIQQSGWQFTGMVASAWLAANTSSYSWPIFSNFFIENLISWGVTWVYFEATYFIYYACNTNWNELVGRVRSEYRNHAGWGIAIMSGKVLLATVPPLGVGMLSAFIKTMYSQQIQDSYALQILCMPPISRVIDATIGLPLYMLSWKAIHKIHPVKPYRYTYNAPLHIAQRGLDKGVRGFNSTSVTKFSFAIYRRFGPAFLLHHRNIPIVVGVFDAGLYYLDSGIANMVPNHPFKRRQHQVNELQIASVNNDVEAQTAIEVYDPSLVARNAMVRGRAYNDNVSSRINSVGGKVAWNIALTFFALGMVVSINLISNAVQEDKENLSEPFYTGYLLLLALVSQFSRLLFQAAVPPIANKIIDVAPRIKDKVTGCCATTFSKKPRALPATNERTLLVDVMESPPPARLRLTNNQEDN